MTTHQHQPVPLSSPCEKMTNRPRGLFARAGLLLVMLFFVFAAVLPPLAAQDVIIGEPVTYTGLDAKEDGKSLAPLKLTRNPKPKYPDELRKSDIYGYAIALSPTYESIRRALDGKDQRPEDVFYHFSLRNQPNQPT